MIHIRRSSDRGTADHGWLQAKHTFSFADYVDPNYMSFRTLRVMNEDRIGPGGGFGMHGHRDMEIVTYVLSGQLQHRDSMGNNAVIQPGELQRMTAGTGIRHSEFNPSNTEATHLYQIWLLPRTTGLTPGYEQTAFPADSRRNRWRLVASPDGEDGSLTIQQDVRIHLSAVDSGRTIAASLATGRYGWLQVLRGAVTLNGSALSAGDGAAIAEESALTVTAQESAEVMLFDLA